VKRLVKDKDVDVKSIRVFALVGGAKKSNAELRLSLS